MVSWTKMKVSRQSVAYSLTSVTRLHRRSSSITRTLGGSLAFIPSVNFKHKRLGIVRLTSCVPCRTENKNNSRHPLRKSLILASAIRWLGMKPLVEPTIGENRKQHCMVAWWRWCTMPSSLPVYHPLEVELEAIGIFDELCALVIQLKLS